MRLRVKTSLINRQVSLLEIGETVPLALTRWCQRITGSGCTVASRKPHRASKSSNMGDAASDGSPLLGRGCSCDASVRATWGELRVIGRANMDTRPEGSVALLLAWIVSLVDVNQILRPHAV